MPITFDQAVKTFRERSLHELGHSAAGEKDRRFGSNVFWVKNLHLNYTNRCRCQCVICGFAKSPDDPDSYVLSVDEILDRISDARRQGITHVHIVGGINPELRYEYYLEMIGEIRRAFASIIIKAFTASEIDLLAEISGLDVQRVLEELKDKGLNLLPGGGAEIFSSRVRKQLFPNKISAERWLEIHRIAHSVGLSSNATMLFGHIETVEERIDHIFRIRDLQEKTGGFSAFVPFPVRGFGTLSEIDGLDALRTLAMSRILLDNVEHIKVFWPIWGLKLTQLALSYGADDVDGTVQEYKIVEQNGLCAEDLQSLIREAGFEPVLGS